MRSPRSIIGSLLRRFLKPESVILPHVLVERHVTLDGCDLIGSVRVGYRSYSNSSLLRNVTIGRFCSIGRRCSIGAARHFIDGITTHPVGAPPEFDSDPPTLIGNDVWIGDNVVVVAGVTIGDGAIIGGGAVVTRDVTPYSIVGGVPARLIRNRFPADQVLRLLETQWWTLGDAALGQCSISDIDGAIQHVESNSAAVLPAHHAPFVKA